MYSPRKVQRPNTSGVSLCMHAAHQRQSVNEQGEEIERGKKSALLETTLQPNGVISKRLWSLLRQTSWRCVWLSNVGIRWPSSAVTAVVLFWLAEPLQIKEQAEHQMTQNELKFQVCACCQENVLTDSDVAACVRVLRYWRVFRGPDWVPQPLPLCQPAWLVPLWMQKWFPWQWILPARRELLHRWAYTELKLITTGNITSSASVCPPPSSCRLVSFSLSNYTVTV